MRVVIALVAGLTLVTTACANTQQNASPATPATTPAASTSRGQGSADPAKVRFADGMCGALAKFIVPATNYKPDTSSPAGALNSLKTQLATMSDGLTEANKDFENVDTQGVPDGKAAVDDVRSTFEQVKQKMDVAKTKLDAVNPNDPQAVSAGVQEATKDLASVSSVQNPMSQPTMQSPDMQQAAEQAPKCQQIKDLITAKVNGSTTPAPTS